MIAPRSTYRVQINTDFNLESAAECVSYLKELGIDCLYSSPYLQAASGSTHGYDTVNYAVVNQAWGGFAGHNRLGEELQRHQMGQVIDIVPNHMATDGDQNPWWWDVLENGPSSAFASFFDVDWDPPERNVKSVVLVPVLGDHYGRIVEQGELQLVRVRTELRVRYHEHTFPVAPRSIARVLQLAVVKYDDERLAFLADALGDLPAPTALELGAVQRRHRDRRILLAMLGELIAHQPALTAAIDAAIHDLNADHAALHDFLERQNYRLAYWRTASHDLGYRRFFDINTLIGLRMEDDRVFAAAHELVIGWGRDGRIRGVRVDHPDGMRDPSRYFQRLHAAFPDTWISAEKILAHDESLPPDWPIAGTTGYDFMNIAGGVFIDPAGEAPLTRFYEEFTGEDGDFGPVASESKLLILKESLGGDINRLTAMFHYICDADWHYRDFTRYDVQEVLRTTLICLDVYRTYVGEASAGDAENCRRITTAIAKAKVMRAEIDPRLFDFFEAILMREVPGDLCLELALRFQQTSAATMAKGVEDTAFYRYNRLLALNEVGGAPARFGSSLAQFNGWCTEIAARWPETMLATSTHDSKRSEDVRARLNVLSEIPQRWRDAVIGWSANNDQYRRDSAPDRNIEYHLYQTLAGAWPLEPSRVLAYMQKAAREAKRFTTWGSPNQEYETKLARFVEKVMADHAFVMDLANFVNEIIEPGRVNSLALTLLKLTVAGVPDFYQGTELWSLTLVDPDNRRPIDYALRRCLLEELKTANLTEIVRRVDEGLPKLWLIKQGLALRNRYPERFGPEAPCLPLDVRGADADHVIAIGRGDGMIALAPRLTLSATGGWRETSVQLPEGDWTNVLSGEQWRGGTRSVQEIWRRFPVAMLVREGDAR